ncbi:MAG: epoxyqueuosine reductase QueH [Clostridia bacterium]|nr:epoxyqueuosine reductase QueH [Clostridia bacterium]
MKKILLHTCCAPCSTFVIKKLREEGYEDITSYWYNINIHPYTEYKQRLETLIEYTKMIDIPLVIDYDYGIREFTKAVIDNIDARCGFCYRSRLERTVKYAKENGYDAFSTTLLVSPYQKHELIIKIAEELASEYGIDFIYYDFREGFREGQQMARDAGLYMQKYCGCIYSEENRYNKQIEKDKNTYLI